MSPDKQRIAIAEACGWQNVKREWTGCGGGTDGKDYAGDNPHGGRWFIPDYPNDLNAMHEAEKVLLPKLAHKYKLALAGLKGFSGNDHDKIWHATAAQRAEAFLRTIGKWDDSK